LPTLEPDLVPVISAPPEGIVGQPIRFDASGSHSANPIASYAWEFGDGTTAEGMAVDKVYGALGNYNVRLTLTDNQGLQASVDVGIRIMPQAALPTLEPEPVPTLLPEVTSIPEAIPTSAP
ncbi:MAG: PKD domain-containing protein, partial [Anaerolineae bacterium]